MNLYGSGPVYFMLFAVLFVLQLFWLRIRTVRHERSAESFRTRKLDIVFILCIAFAAATLFRLYPGNARPPIQDSSAFLYIGERMAEGKLPYRDLFDHKGPLLYLIQWCGICLTPGSYTGVWLLEVLNLATTAAFMLKLAGLGAEYRASAYLSVIAVLGVCGWMVWQGGNFTEEYALPWISSAAFICCSFFQSGTYRCRDVGFLGIGFAAVLLLRANMIAAWASFMPIILIMLLKDSRFGDIGKCAICFLSGMLLVFGPVLIWAWRAGFLREMWDDYILFNFRYTDSVSADAREKLWLMARFAEILWPGTAAALLAAVMSPRKRLLWYNLIFLSVSVITAAMSGRMYYHYAIVMLPAMILPLCDCFDRTARILQKDEQRRNPQPFVMFATFFLMVVGAVTYRCVFAYAAEDEPVTAYLKENTGREDDVLIVGNSSWYYLLTDRKTENRFFYQLPPLEISEELRNEFYERLERNPSDCIVLPGYRDERDWTDEELHGLRTFLETGTGETYVREEYDEFEVYIRQ